MVQTAKSAKPERSPQSTVDDRKALLTKRFAEIAEVVRSNIVNRRAQRGLTQRQLAKAAGVSQGVIYQLETGRIGTQKTLVRFSMTAVAAVAKVLNVPVWALFIPEAFLETVDGTNWQSIASAIGQLSDADLENRTALCKALQRRGS